MNAARGSVAAAAAVAMVIAAPACESFGEGSQSSTPPPDATTPAPDAGPSGPDGGGDVCSADAFACHFFDGALVQTPWEAVGRDKGTGLFKAVVEGERSFGRAAIEADARTKLEDRLRTTLSPAKDMVEIELDFRVNAMLPSQRL